MTRTRIPALLPRPVFEPEKWRVFGHGSLDLIRGSARKINGDFYRHFNRGIWIAAQNRDDLLGDRDETHFGCSGSYIG